jgi:hypothetical protein
MKKTLLITTILLLVSCGRPAMDMTREGIITKIESSHNGLTGDDSRYGCYYYYNSGTGGTIKNMGYFFDSCGKFNVGDSIKIVKK